MKRVIGFAILTTLYICFTITNIKAATFTVTRNDDRNVACQSGIDCSLREAIASTVSGELIVFDSAIFDDRSPITLILGELLISNKITICGLRSSQLSIHRDGLFATPSRVFTVSRGGELTLINATVSGGTAPLDFGGGIFNEGTVTLINTTIRDNSAGEGGGIENRGILNVTNSTISNNIANHPQTTFAWGGGIANFGSMTLVNTTISNNQSGRGGGISMALS